MKKSINTNKREQNFQKYDGFTLIKDRLIMSVFDFIPFGFTPNHVTMLRLLMIPFVMYFIVIGDIKIAFTLFIIAAFTDALDGAMARRRDQITEWGKLFDPIADKILITTVSVLMLTQYINNLFTLTIIVLESLLILGAYIQNKKTKHNIQANWAGKLKMFLQCSAIAFIFIFSLTGNILFKDLCVYTLSASFIFAIVSLLYYKSI